MDYYQFTMTSRIGTTAKWTHGTPAALRALEGHRLDERERGTREPRVFWNTTASMITALRGLINIGGPR